MSSDLFESSSDILYSNGIKSVWTGEFIKDGSLTADGMLRLKSIFYNPEQIDGSWRDLTRYNLTNNEGCLVAEVGEETFYTLRNCSEILPFVCIKTSSYNVKFQPISVCPEGWLGDYRLRKCYRLFYEKVTYYEAVDFCSSHQSTLMKLENEELDHWAGQIVDYDKSSNTTDSVWVEWRDGSCSVRNQISNTTNKVSSCGEKLGFICSRAVQYPVCDCPRCLNGGFLSSSTTSDCICVCRRGYTGSQCQIDECKKIVPTCRYGNAVGTYGSCYCQCDAGFTGSNCDLCDSCLNGGVQASSTNCTCTCPPEYTGTTCEVEVAHICSPCLNGGTPSSSTNDCSCSCRDGYSGLQCQIGCTASCQNGGSKDGCACICVNGWTGQFCEIVPRCLEKTCSGRGTSTIVQDVCQCICNPGFTGPNCEANLCTNADCNFRGTPFYNVARGTCSCANCQTDWTGDACQTRVCVDTICHNGGIPIYRVVEGEPLCGCRCPPQYTGPNCESPVLTAPTPPVSTAPPPLILTAPTPSEGISCSDIMIVIGGSETVRLNQSQIKEYLTNLIDSFTNVPNRMGLVIYGRDDHYVTELTTDKYQLYKNIISSNLPNTGDDLAAGILEATRYLVESYRPTMLIIVDDSAVLQYPTILNGIQVLVIGVGEKIRYSRLVDIAGGKERNVFFVKSFRDLNSVNIRKYVCQICNDADVCYNRGKAFFDVLNNQCGCACYVGYLQPYCLKGDGPCGVPVLNYILSKDEIITVGDSSWLLGEGVDEILVPLKTQFSVSSPGNLLCYADQVIPDQQVLQFVKDGIYLDAESAENSISVSMALPQYTDLKLREIVDTIGYFWCEMRDLNTWQTQRSRRVYLNMEDMVTFSGCIQLPSTTVNLPVNTRFSTQKGEAVIKHLRLGKRDTILDFQIFWLGNVIPDSESDYNDIMTLIRQELLFIYSDYGDVIKLQSSDVCLSTNISYYSLSNDLQEVTIPLKPLRYIWEIPEKCPLDGQPLGYMVCDGDKLYGAHWVYVPHNLNCNFTGLIYTEFTRNLSIFIMTLNRANAATIIKTVVKEMKEVDKVVPIDVIYSGSLVDKVANMPALTDGEIYDILYLIDLILDIPEDVLFVANSRWSITDKLLVSLEHLELTVPITDVNPIRRVTKNTLMVVWDLKNLDEDIPIGLVSSGDKKVQFYIDDLSTLYDQKELIYSTADVGIFLDRNFVQSIIAEENSTDIRLAMHAFRNANLFIKNLNSRTNPATSSLILDSTRYKPNSKIISAILAVDGVPRIDLKGSVATTVFYPDQVLQSDVRRNFTICVYWDVAAGSWSTDGCRYLNTNTGRDVCVCDHLTNFAILLDLYGQDHLLPEEHQVALSLITIIGLIISIIGLGFTIVSFLVFKKLREGRVQHTLFNLALAMLCSWVVFLVGLKRTDSPVGCIVVAAMLHYFIMASFMWMLMEGILQYLLFVKVFGTQFSYYMLKTAIPAWGIPIVPIAIMLAIDTELYNGGNTYCWMSLTGFYYGFVIPLGLIILTNIFIYVLVTYKICKRANISGVIHSAGSQTVSNIRISISCFMILGLSWIFGFLAIADARLVFQYIFTIINSLQGFFIFLLFTYRKMKNPSSTHTSAEIRNEGDPPLIPVRN